jgi:hypothetical protein
MHEALTHPGIALLSRAILLWLRSAVGTSICPFYILSNRLWYSFAKGGRLWRVLSLQPRLPGNGRWQFVLLSGF